LELALNDAEKLDVTNVLIYYVGHGNKTDGGWIMNGGEGINDMQLCVVEIGEILNLINNNFDMDIGYEITSESCYSGKACHEAKKWFEEKKLAFLGRSKFLYFLHLK